MHVGGVEVVFSYQVAVGSTMSEYRQVVLMRKSSVTNRSSLPSGPGYAIRPLGLGIVGTQVLPCTPWVVPSRCLRKYSWPLPDEPRMLDRHTNMLRGQFRDYPDLHMTASGCRPSERQRCSPWHPALFCSGFATSRVGLQLWGEGNQPMRSARTL